MLEMDADVNTGMRYVGPDTGIASKQMGFDWQIGRKRGRVCNRRCRFWKRLLALWKLGCHMLRAIRHIPCPKLCTDGNVSAMIMRARQLQHVHFYSSVSLTSKRKLEDKIHLDRESMESP
jgi:hypothetical protein